MSKQQPQLWVFAGPNGARESTLVRRYKVAERIPVVNADDIADVLRRGNAGLLFGTLKCPQPQHSVQRVSASIGVEPRC